MKILLIEGNSFPPEHEWWPKKLMNKYQAADIVLYLFSPYSTYIMKSPAGLEVDDVRKGFRGFSYLKGSGSQIFCALEHDKLKVEER